MKRGYSIFGKAYQIMLENDVHDIKSIDHQFMQQMVLLDEKSRPYLYNTKPVIIDMSQHELFDFSQQFRKNDELKTVTAVLDHTGKAAKTYNVNMKDMVFGGTEKEILERGTNWCADLAREAAVLLDCVSIPCRIVHLVNPDAAYHGHVVVEAFYHGKYGVIDPTQGYCFYNKKPLDAYELKNNPSYFEKFDEEYAGLYKAMAINEYNPLDDQNDYTKSKLNAYYLKIFTSDHNGNWIMGEDK